MTGNEFTTNEEKTIRELMKYGEPGVMFRKTAQEMAARELVDAVLNDGNLTPVDAYLNLRVVQALIDLTVAKLAAEIINDPTLDTTYTKHGAKVSTANAADKYDFSADDEWSRINDDIERSKFVAKGYTDALKAREKFLLSLLKDGTRAVDFATGELIPKPVLVEYGKRSVRVEFPR